MQLRLVQKRDINDSKDIKDNYEIVRILAVVFGGTTQKIVKD